MNTEITDTVDASEAGWVCYDGGCAICRRWAGRFRRLLERHGFRVVPLQSPDVRRRLNLPEAELLAEMRVITGDGSVFGGADAVLHLAKRIPWGWPLSAIACLPGAKGGLRRLYHSIARNRECDTAACSAPQIETAGPGNWAGWVPLVLLTTLAVILGQVLPSWGFMWALAFAMFAGCKWLTFWTALLKGSKPGVGRAIGYLLAWPGMDAREFLATRPIAEKPRAGEWLFAVGKTLLGTVLVWILARRFTTSALWAGWVGMIGLMFVLHFGLLHLLSLFWRKAGVKAPPLMRAPVLSVSLGEFWGARWNTGFQKLAHEFMFRPLRRGIGPRAGLWAVFLASGLIHDLVISVPAGGGYGLPTIYFLVQGAGILFERTGIARRSGVGRGWRGRLFTLAMTAGPAFWLFHPPFVNNVMIPFLKLIRAI